MSLADLGVGNQAILRSLVLGQIVSQRLVGGARGFEPLVDESFERAEICPELAPFLAHKITVKSAERIVVAFGSARSMLGI
jgi:hypothetical protein